MLSLERKSSQMDHIYTIGEWHVSYFWPYPWSINFNGLQTFVKSGKTGQLRQFFAPLIRRPITMRNLDP